MNKNIPNYLTTLRIIAIPIIVISFYYDNSILTHRIGALIFAIASLTDFLDGFLARKYNIISNFGRMLDPIADKLLVVCVLCMLVKFNRADAIPCLLIISREFVVAGLREFLAQIKVCIPVTWLAKTKTFIQMVAITMLLLGSKGSDIESLDCIGHILLWMSVIVTIATGYAYFKVTLKYI